MAVYGFAVAAMWIALFASEIVGLLQFFGMLRCAGHAVVGQAVAGQAEKTKTSPHRESNTGPQDVKGDHYSPVL